MSPAPPLVAWLGDTWTNAWPIVPTLAGQLLRGTLNTAPVTNVYWLLFGLVWSAAAPLALLLATGWGLAAFAAYRLGVALTLRGWRLAPETAAPRLLLLRVFGYQGRTEALFDRVAQEWRFHGPVQLIAGVDLAMRTADPGDVLGFVNGRLADRYVATLGEVSERLGGLDLGRDPDGRFRVNEVSRHDDTWRQTLEALLDASGCVLMDLRSFGQLNPGCRFELEQVLRRVPSDRFVLVCDPTTDLRFVAELLGEAWRSPQSEGRARGSGQLGLVRVDGHSARELRVLMRRLLGTAGAPRLVAPAELPGAFA